MTKKWDVRTGVARNSHTPVEVLRKLAEDKDENVRESARKSIAKKDIK